MATLPDVVVTGTVIESAWGNDVRTAITENPAYLATAAGSAFYSSAAGVLAELTASGNGGKFLRFNAAEDALEAAEVPTLIVADAFEWGTKVANRYVANFTSDTLLSNAVHGDLVDVGWTDNTTAGPSSPINPSTGDLDSASDAGAQFILLNAASTYFASPKIVGGSARLDDIEFHTGTRPTLVTARVRFRSQNTTDVGDGTGVGIGDDSNAALNTGAGSQFMVTVGATNFEAWDGAAATDLGVAKDTNVHNADFEIDFAAATYRVLLDGTERKAAAAIAQDHWPMCVRAFMESVSLGLELFSFGVKYE